MAYKLFETITVGAGGASSIQFDNIPQTGKDLCVVYSLRSTTTGFNVFCRYNGDSSANYSHRTINGFGDSVSSTFTSSDTQAFCGRITPSSHSSNTFSNQTMYVTNYTSTTNKIVSVDSVSENNDIAAYQTIQAIGYNTSSPISSLTLFVTSGSLEQNSTASLYIIDTADATGATGGFAAPKATGGTITLSGGYFYHVFNSSGTFTPTQSITADILVVAGGGGGAGTNTGNSVSGGGGGAGGYRALANQSLIAGPYTVTVGAGGAGGAAGLNQLAGSGSSSSFSGTSSTGGGGARSWTGNSSGTGASGGSGAGAAGFSQPGAGTAGQGNNGGSSPFQPGGGGGGAGAVGQTVTADLNGGNGGNGLQWLNGTFYAGGGGGGGTTSGVGGTGGSGGGGTGGTKNGDNDTAGGVNTGGGGGGAAWPAGTQYAGSAGGSGIVIVRYAA